MLVPLRLLWCLRATYKKFRRKPEGAEGAKEFPILDKLDTDPHLLSTIDNGINSESDGREGNTEQYLATLSGDTLVKDMWDVNDYIRGVIALPIQTNTLS